jgi:Protein of unknown function (DUF3127).
MSYEMSGEITSLSAEAKVGAHGVPHRVAIVRGFCGPRIAQNLPVEFFGRDAVSLLKGINEGDEIIVLFDIHAREWNGRAYVSLSARDVQKLSADSIPPPEIMPPTNGNSTESFHEYNDD